MMYRNVHYEAAFEDYLQAKGWPYVAVDEAKKAVFGAVSIKSFDFLLYSASGPNLLVNVKGRKFPDTGGGANSSSRAWENWITTRDAEDLGKWQTVFGGEFNPVLVFAYWLQGPPARAPFRDVHLFGARHYAFMAVPLTDYLAEAKQRSSKWQTISIPSGKFASLARYVDEML